jgi:Carboxypeptidase regulatory-like domain/TonB dependent receptor
VIPRPKKVAMDLFNAANISLKVNTMRISSLARQLDWSSVWRALRALWLGASLFFVCLPAFPQGAAGRISGRVADQKGGVLTGAMVTVTDTQRDISRVLTTDNAGEYNAPNLLPSIYVVRAEAAGFKVTEQPNIALEVNGNVRVDLVMQLGERSENIVVSGTLPSIETTNAVLGGTIPNEVINDLPLNGRNFENLLVLRPGTVKYPGGSAWTQSTNGLRPHDQNYQMDGVNTNDPWMAQSIMNAVMPGGDAGTILPIDAIDEFRTQQNPGAQYGWKPAGIINVGIKSGNNTLHGSAYAYGRDNSWDARSFFNPAPLGGVCSLGPLPSCDQATLALEQFGATLGGPIKQDKLFYFLNYEQQQYTNGNPVPHSVPITAGPGASDSNFGLIGACMAAGAKLAPLSAQLAGLSMSCAPLSNYPGFFPAASGPAGGAATLETLLNTTNTIHSGIVKVDYHINDKNSVDASYFISPGGGAFVDNPTIQIATQWLTNQYGRSQVFSGNWTFRPNSNWVNEVRVGYSHLYEAIQTNDYAQNPASYSFNGTTYNIFTGQTDIGTPGSGAFGGLPLISFGGYSMLFGNPNWPKYIGPDGVLNIVEHLSYLRGNHSFLFGAESLNNWSTNIVTNHARGSVGFGGGQGQSLDRFFIGKVNVGNFAGGQFSDWQRHLSDSGYAVFFQDDWRIRPRLMLNLGLRYELNTVLKDRNNELGNFDPTVGLVQVSSGMTSPYNGDHHNFAPRIGIAWDVLGNGKTVVRASGGIMYEQFSFDTFDGLRTVPTGATLAYTDPATGLPVITSGPGTINIGTVVYTQGTPAAIALKANWQSNSSAKPLFFGSLSCGDGTQPLLDMITPQPCEIEAVTRNLRTPYVSTWTLDLQRAITSNLSLDIAYVGNHGTKLLGLIDLNQPPVGSGWGSAAVAGTALNTCVTGPGPTNCSPNGAMEVAAKPFATKFPYLGYIDLLSNLDHSNYNALQVTLTQRASHGLSFVAGYTYSHALGMTVDNCCISNPINAADYRQLYGNTVFDLTHNFTLSTTYNLPGKKSFGQLLQGWSLNSVVTLQSGMPWSVTDFTDDFSGTGEIGDASSVGEAWNFYGNHRDFASNTAFLNNNGGAGGIPYFPGACASDGACSGPPAAPTSNAACNSKAAGNPAAVASLSVLGCYANGGSVLIPAPYGALGNSGVNQFRGFPFFDWDLSVTKSFKLKERLSAQFRAEEFNILNHVNFSNPFSGPGGDFTYTDPSVAGPSFGFRPQTPDLTSSNPILGSGGPRAIQLGLKLIW